ncbi:carbohydrate ABC transporter permease, partial [Nocardia sp. NPDC004260]
PTTPPDTAAPKPCNHNRSLLLRYEVDIGSVMAGTLLTMLPILVVFLVLQRHMIKGLTSGAVKG